MLLIQLFEEYLLKTKRPMLHSQQTGEYATDEEDAGTAVDGGDKSIEVFDLPESEDILSPSELDASKLYQKFREVMLTFENFKRNPQKLI